MTVHVHGLPRSVRLYGCAPTVTPRRVVTASKAASYSELWKALSPCSSAHSRLTCAGVGKLALLHCIAKMQILSSPIKETSGGCKSAVRSIDNTIIQRDLPIAILAAMLRILQCAGSTATHAGRTHQLMRVPPPKVAPAKILMPVRMQNRSVHKKLSHSRQSSQMERTVDCQFTQSMAPCWLARREHLRCRWLLGHPLRTYPGKHPAPTGTGQQLWCNSPSRL